MHIIDFHNFPFTIKKTHNRAFVRSISISIELGHHNKFFRSKFQAGLDN